jgi:hypothetical protein
MYIEIQDHTLINSKTRNTEYNGSPLQYARDLIRSRSPLAYCDCIQIVKASETQYQLYGNPGWNLLFTITGVK